MVNATPRLLYPWARAGTHCIGGWVGPRGGLDRCRKSCPQRDSIPRPSRLQRVATPNELCRTTPKWGTCRKYNMPSMNDFGLLYFAVGPLWWVFCKWFLTIKHQEFTSPFSTNQPEIYPSAGHHKATKLPTKDSPQVTQFTQQATTTSSFPNYNTTFGLSWIAPCYTTSNQVKGNDLEQKEG